MGASSSTKRAIHPRSPIYGCFRWLEPASRCRLFGQTATTSRDRCPPTVDGWRSAPTFRADGRYTSSHSERHEKVKHRRPSPRPRPLVRRLSESGESQTTLEVDGRCHRPEEYSLDGPAT